MKLYTSIKQLCEAFLLSETPHPRPKIHKTTGVDGGLKQLKLTKTTIHGKETDVGNIFEEYTRIRDYFDSAEHNHRATKITLEFNGIWCIDVKYEAGNFWVIYVYCHYDLMVGYGKWGNQFIEDFRSWEYGMFEHNTLSFTDTQSYNDEEFEKVESNMYRHPQLQK